MNKKKSVKKKAVPAKRKYSRRTLPDKIKQKESAKTELEISTTKLEESLFKIEKFDGDFNRQTFQLTQDYAQLKEAITKVKPSEAFVIRKKWGMHAYRMVDDLQLKIKIKIVAIPGVEYARVVRLS